MNTLQGSTIIIVGITLAGIAAFIIGLILRRSSVSLRQKDTEILYREELHNLKSIVSGQVRTKQLELSMDAINVSDEDVYCDKTRLNQVLLNLMSNAIKFTPAGGTVSVQLRQLPSSQSGRAPKRQKGAAVRARRCAHGTQGEALRTPPERAVAAAPYAGNLRKFWGECSKMAKMMHLHSRG